jgi:hypothetical protein
LTIPLSKTKKAAKLGRHAQAYADKKPKDYGINTRPTHKAIIYSVSFWFFAVAALSSGFLFSFFSGFFLSSFKSVCEAQRSKS